MKFASAAIAATFFAFVSAEQTPETDSEEDEELLKRVEYFHITACSNGGIAPLDANFARNIYLNAKKRSSKKPNKGFLDFVDDFGK